MFLSEWREITGSTMTGRTIVNKRQKRTLRWIVTHLVTKNLIKSRLHLVTRVRWWLNTPVTAGCQQNSITFNTWQFYPLFLQWQRKYYEEGIFFFFFSRGAPEENTNPSCNTKKKTMTHTKLLWTLRETDFGATAAGSVQHGIPNTDQAGPPILGEELLMVLYFYSSSFHTTVSIQTVWKNRVFSCVFEITKDFE